MRTKANIIKGIAAILCISSPFFLAAQGQAPSSGQDNNKPDVRISVHKQTDENGNIISYDSTYSYTYTTGKGYSNADLDSILRQYDENMNSIFFSTPLNTPDLSNYPFIQQFNVIDFDKLNEMMEKEMNDMMQNYGMPPCCHGFFCQPPPTQRCCPKDSTPYRQQRMEKKSTPPHNKSNGGVQI